MTHDLVTIYVAANLPQAFLLKNLLAEYGIEVRVLDEAIHSFAEDPTNWRSQPRVAVRREDAEFSREIAEEFDQQVRRGSEAVARGAGAGPSDPERWEDWPACPKCSELRPTACPSCHTRGIDFPLAEFVPGRSADQPVQFVADGLDTPGEPVQLVCGVCDEIFRPRHPRRCARCGHDFGDGIEAPRQTAGDEQLNLRAATLLGLLVVLATVVVAILTFAWSR